MAQIFFATLQEEFKKIANDYAKELEILYYTGRDIRYTYIRISNTPIYGEEGYFITASIDIYSTCNTKLASVIIPTSLGFQEAQKIYRRLKLLDVHIFTPCDGEYNPKKWMRETYPYDQGFVGTIYHDWISEE